METDGQVTLRIESLVLRFGGVAVRYHQLLTILVLDYRGIVNEHNLPCMPQRRASALVGDGAR